MENVAEHVCAECLIECNGCSATTCLYQDDDGWDKLPDNWTLGWYCKKCINGEKNESKV